MLGNVVGTLLKRLEEARWDVFDLVQKILKRWPIFLLLGIIGVAYTKYSRGNLNPSLTYNRIISLTTYMREHPPVVAGGLAAITVVVILTAQTAKWIQEIVYEKVVLPLMFWRYFGFRPMEDDPADPAARDQVFQELRYWAQQLNTLFKEQIEIQQGAYRDNPKTGVKVHRRLKRAIAWAKRALRSREHVAIAVGYTVWAKSELYLTEKELPSKSDRH